MARRGENIHKRKDGQWEGRYIKARTPEGKIQWGYVYGIVYPERRLWSIFRCDLPSTAPWSSVPPSSGSTRLCRRCSPCHDAILLRCSIVEFRTKCAPVPKEPAVLRPITSDGDIHGIGRSANTDSAFHSGHLPLLLRYWVGLSCRSPQTLTVSVICTLIVLIIDYLRAKRKSVSTFAALLDIGVIL